MTHRSRCSTVCRRRRSVLRRTVVERVLASGRAWVSLARFEERDVVRICVTHGETSDEDLSILLDALTRS